MIPRPPHPSRRLFLLAISAIVLGCGSGVAATDDLLRGLEDGDQRVTASSSTIKDRSQRASDDFIPLLAPARKQKVASSRAANVFHGRLRSREIYQRTNRGTHQLSSRLDSKGSLERLQGRPLALTWNGNMSYRQGNTFSSASDYEQARLHLFDLALTRKEDDGGLGRAGRFIPAELSGLGYLDGLQLERHPTDTFHLGALAGARPERRELGVSSRELLNAFYGSYERGSPGDHHYSGTLGLFQSFWGGVRDELALLYDHQADIGPKLNLYMSSQLNFNSGAARVHTDSARVTRLNVYANSKLFTGLDVRSGLEHFERPDTAAERDLSGVTNREAFDSGYWRYWAGSRQTLPWNVQTDEEVSLIQAPGQSDETQLRGTLSRQGLFWMPQASLSLTAYTLNRVDGEGMGSLVTGIFPLFDYQLYLTASSGFRYSAQEGQRKSFQANDASLYINWILSKHWEADLGITQTYQDYIQSTLADVSLSYRW